MRCLLDKVTARHAVRGLLKSSLNLLPEPDEILALKVLTLRPQSGIEHFIAIPTANVLGQFVQNPRYQAVIHLFLDQVQIATPGRYYKRWSRRLRDFGFTREDAAILALATFGTEPERAQLGMDAVVTFDQPMINNWTVQQRAIAAKLTAMKEELSPPYRHVPLPLVSHPEALLR